MLTSKGKSWAMQDSTVPVKWYHLGTYITPWLCSACRLCIFLHACAHLYTPHICTHTHINIQHTHKQAKQGRAGPITPNASPHDTFRWVLRPERPDEGRGGEDCMGGWGQQLFISQYVYFCWSHPPLQLSHSLHKPLIHPLLLTSSSFALLTVLFLLSCLSDNSKQKFNILEIWN